MSFSTPCRAAMHSDCEEIHNDRAAAEPMLPPPFPFASSFSSSQLAPFKKRRLHKKRDLSSSSSFSDSPLPPPPKLRRLVASYWSSSTTATNGAQPKSTTTIDTRQSTMTTTGSIQMSMMTQGNNSTTPDWLEITRGPPTSGSCYYEEQDTIFSTTTEAAPHHHYQYLYAPRSIFSTIQPSRNRNDCSSSSSSGSSYGSSEKNDCEDQDNHEDDAFPQWPISVPQQQHEQNPLCHPRCINNASHDEMDEEELVMLVGGMKHANTSTDDETYTANVTSTHSDPYHRSEDSTYNNVTPSPNMMQQEQHHLSSFSCSDAFAYEHHNNTARMTVSPLPAPPPLWEPWKAARENQTMEPLMERKHHPHEERASRSHQMVNHRPKTIGNSTVLHDQAFSGPMSSASDEDHHAKGSFFVWKPSIQGGGGGRDQQRHTQLRILPPPLDSPSSLSPMTMETQIPSPPLLSYIRTGDEYNISTSDCVFWNQHQYRTPVVPPNSPLRFHEIEEHQQR